MRIISRQQLLVFVFLWWTALGLGYASLGRFYAPDVAGLSDTGQYFRLAESGTAGVRAPICYRLLVPYSAGRIAVVLRRIPMGHWNPIAAAFLLVSSAFASLNALVVGRIGQNLGSSHAESLLASVLTLVSFCTVNMQLVGLVDSVETLSVSAVILAAMSGNELLIPAIVGVGVLGKETVLPLALAFLGPYVILSEVRWRRLGVFVATAVLGTGVYVSAHGLVGGPGYAAHKPSLHQLSSFGILSSVLAPSKTFLYQFAVLLPVGVFGLRSLQPSKVLRWFYPSVALMVSAVVVLALYAHVNGENIVRPLASVTSAVLCVGAARALNVAFGK